MMNETIASTLYGQVRGIVRDNGIHVFKGIPYGASTAGARRFRPPVPAEPWESVREATLYGSSCPQGKPTLPRQDPASIKGLEAPD